MYDTQASCPSIRRRLFHCDISGAYQVITYRLGDSLPAVVLSSCREHGRLAHEKTQRRKQIEKYLDAGYGSCILKIPAVASIVIDSWQYFHNEHYELIAYVVMPNHVHLLVKTYPDYPLRNIVHSWKSYTAKEINKCISHGRDAHAPGFLHKSEVWQANYWDRLIRHEKHFNSMINYIHENPVKAGLCLQAEDWLRSSVLDFSKGI